MQMQVFMWLSRSYQMLDLCLFPNVCFCLHRWWTARKRYAHSLSCNVLYLSFISFMSGVGIFLQQVVLMYCLILYIYCLISFKIIGNVFYILCCIQVSLLTVKIETSFSVMSFKQFKCLEMPNFQMHMHSRNRKKMCYFSP